jgi:hypothetical protein
MVPHFFRWLIVNGSATIFHNLWNAKLQERGYLAVPDHVVETPRIGKDLLSLETLRTSGLATFVTVAAQFGASRAAFYLLNPILPKKDTLFTNVTRFVVSNTLMSIAAGMTLPLVDVLERDVAARSKRGHPALLAQFTNGMFTGKLRSIVYQWFKPYAERVLGQLERRRAPELERRTDVRASHRNYDRCERPSTHARCFRKQTNVDHGYSTRVSCGGSIGLSRVRAALDD